MKAFKYLILLSLFFSVNAFAVTQYYLSAYPASKFSTAMAACLSRYPTTASFSSVMSGGLAGYCKASNGGDLAAVSYVLATCPSATEVTLKVPVNAQKYQCVEGCQYALTKCVDIDFEPGMTCDAISTGQDCGATAPTDTTTKPDTGTPATPDQNSTNTNTNSSTSTGTSTSTSTSTSTTDTATNTTTTTTNTTTTNNITTEIDLSSLESVIESVGSLLSNKIDEIKALFGEGEGTDLTETNEKLDEIKSNGDDLNTWLQGDGVGDNPFGTDLTPERSLDQQSFQTNIFQSSAQCPQDRTLSMTLFTGRTFSKTFSFSMWCDKLAMLGSLILIASYFFGALIIVRNS